ncbi:unnamed protein product, partial [Rhizoctonia solani]
MSIFNGVFPHWPAVGQHLTLSVVVTLSQRPDFWHTMTQKPALKDETGHPYPNGHWWLYFTIALFTLALPALVVFNLITQGSELVPSLQPVFRLNGTNPP